MLTGNTKYKSTILEPIYRVSRGLVDSGHAATVFYFRISLHYTIVRVSAAELKAAAL